VATGSHVTAQLVGTLVEGVTPEGALNVAKILRTAGGRLGIDLWPSPGSGVRTSPFRPAHLANLLLALTCGIPAHAAETAIRLRDIPSEERLRARWRQSQEVDLGVNALIDPATYPEVYAAAQPRTITTLVEQDLPNLLAQFPEIFPSTLGGLFDFLIALGDPRSAETTHTMLRKVSILVAPGRWPWAEFVQRGLPGADELEVCLRYAAPVPTSAEPVAPMAQTQVVFDGILFAYLGAILAGTRPDRSTNETAASPAREAAAPGDPPAAEADGCPQQAHPMAREIPSQPSAARVGHLPANTWRGIDAASAAVATAT
jgi:hypothetical protein